MSNEERDETRPDARYIYRRDGNREPIYGTPKEEFDIATGYHRQVVKLKKENAELRESLSASQERERLLREDLRGAYDFLNALAKVLMKSEEEGGDVNLSATITNFLNGEKRGLGASREGGRGWLIGE